jgi:hydrogenase-4 component B
VTAVFGVAMGALALAPFAALRFGRAAAAASFAGCALLIVVGIVAAGGGARPVLALGSWLAFGHSALRADGLAGVFLALTGLAGAAVSLAYIELPAGCWLTGLGSTLLLFCAVAIGSDNGFLFFLAWEALTVCIYLIASAGEGRDPLLGGYLTGGLAKLGGAALLAAFGVLYGETHSLSLQVWQHASLSGSTRGVLFLLFVIAFGSKVGVIPVQGGLPAGYGAAPRLGAASLSVALAAGFYGLWRFQFDLGGTPPEWCGDALLVLGGLTALVGVLYALMQDRLRRFLGYSTVEHAGIALLGLGVALLGLAAHRPWLAAVGLLAATLQVYAHNLAKTLALIGIDRTEQATGEQTLDRLGGLARLMPGTTAGLGVASLTLAALPPLAGFVSEWFTFEALLQGFRMPTLLTRLLCALAAAALALTAGIGLLAFAKYFGFGFLGRAREKRTRLKVPSRPSLAILGLGTILLFLGTIAPWEIKLLGSGLKASLGFNPSYSVISHPLVLGPVFAKFAVLAPTWLSIVLPAYALIAFAIAAAAGRRRGVRRAPVWVTGSGAELSAVQYRPSAYSNPIRVILRGPLGYTTRLIGGGPRQGRARVVLETRVVFAIDRSVYRPAAALALGVAGYVRRSQSGRLSAYLLYMLIAVMVALALIPVLR